MRLFSLTQTNERWRGKPQMICDGITDAGEESGTPGNIVLLNAATITCHIETSQWAVSIELADANGTYMLALTHEEIGKLEVWSRMARRR